VLTDIIDSEQIATVRLTEIFRQASTSKIITNAHRINHGQLPKMDNTQELSDFYCIYAETPEDIFTRLMQVVLERIPQRFNLHTVNDIQVLTPMNRSGLGARSLNIELQTRLNGQSEPKVIRYGSTYAPGDKVIQQVNNYEKEVFNGDIGIVLSVDIEESLLQIQFDDRVVDYEFNELDEISLAYAISIHKAQGSEYLAVVIPLAMQHYMLLERNLLYISELPVASNWS
jgi:exodeoxyribonuclease V alpha subunit